MSRVLVVFGSKHGSTREVASAIADQLHDDGHGVDLFPADVAPAPAGHDAVILGGSLYVGRWHAGVRRYLRRHHAELSALPLAVFALGPRTMSEHDVAESRAQLDAALAKLPDVKPGLVSIFGGVVDPGELHFPFSRMAAADARDWSAIRAWADEASKAFAAV